MARRATAFDLAGDIGLAGLHTGITLCFRLPMLALVCSPFATADHAPELGRMVAEKVAAFAEGAIASQQEVLRVATEAFTGNFDADTPLAAAASVALAGLRPAFFAVRANAERLTRS